MRNISKDYMEKAGEWNEFVKGLYKEDMFKVIFNLRTPVFVFQNIYFDSLLGYAIMKKVFGSDFYNLNRDYFEEIVLYLPVKRIENPKDPDEYFYCCGYIPETTNYIGFYTKKFYKNEIEYLNAKRVELNKGFTKEYKNVVTYRPLKTLEFKVQGNKETVRDLLKEINYIGKKSAAGFGEVEDFVIEDIDNVNEFMFNKDGSLYRPLPIWFFDVENGKKILSPIHPPYYTDKVKLYECYV